MYNCSHRLCATHDNSDRITYHTKMKRVVKVEKNCFIIFHGGLIHAGAPFESTNACYRIHMYIHPQGYVKSLEGKTYRSNIFECDEECRVCTKICENNGM